MRPTVAFEQASYLMQVRRLRNLATNALALYPLKVEKLKFIHHGENATFLVRTTSGRKYLLRILRGGYHTTPAVLEELNWLAGLAEKKIPAPRPIRSKNGSLLEFAKAPGIPNGRQCCIFEWVEGTFISKSVRPEHMYEVGALLARLQKSAPRTRHRRYWDSNGLVGRKPKFGSVDKLSGVGPVTQAIVSRARPKVYAKLRAYERKFPKRFGYIHADLHFGNLLQTMNGIAAIDFDDSGYGFFVYDLVVPLMSARHILGKNRQREHETFKRALIAGYASQARWDEHDERILGHLVAARRITMLGWLSSRSENPRLKAYLKKSARSVAAFLEKNYL